MQFYQRAEIKDILAYLSLINNPLDETNLLRIINIPKRKIGDKTLEKIRSYAGEHSLTFFESLERAGEISGISSGLAGTIQQFYDLIQELMALAPYENTGAIFQLCLRKLGINSI